MSQQYCSHFTAPASATLSLSLAPIFLRLMQALFTAGSLNIEQKQKVSEIFTRKGKLIAD